MAHLDRVHASQLTDVGRVRSHNEDFMGCLVPSSAEERLEHGWLYIVADGVGGAEAGEVASQLATERVIYHFQHNDGKSDEERLWRAIRAANDDVRALAAERGGGYMATTLVAAHFRDSAMLIANVGDSRCYHWRDGELRQITRDQSLVAKLLDEGAITEEEALVHPRRNVILSSLGSSREPQIDFYTEQFEADDKVLLCSDGLIRYVTDSEIAALLDELAVDEATQMLVDLANERGGSDNITVTLLEWAMEAETAPQLVVSADAVAPEQMPSYGLWVYTFFLALVQCILILLIWWALRV